MRHTELTETGRIPHLTIDTQLPTNAEKEALRGADLSTFYFGHPTTDGSWRIYFDGTDLLVQVRVAGVWTTEVRFTP